MRLFSALLLVSACHPRNVELDNRFACDAGRCIDGYVCHPERNLCVRPVTFALVATGDPCPSVGAFLPCTDVVTDCSEGCRTCGDDRLWSACTTPPVCEGIRAGDDCGACEGRCLTLPNVRRSRCEIATGTPLCKVLVCQAGWVDLDGDRTNGCEAACGGFDVCNGIDDDCDGQIDNVALELVQHECGAQHPTAVHIGQWSCEVGTCLLTACAAGFSNDNDSLSDGCEAPCTASGNEVCDGIDNDCDGRTDPPGTVGCVTRFADRDHDGAGDAGDSLCVCPGIPSAIYTASAGADCDDSKSHCVSQCPDVDGDGWCRMEGDCDDTRAQCVDCSTAVCNDGTTPAEPSGIAVTASAVTGGVATVSVTLLGGTFVGRADRISCTVPVQTLRTADFSPASDDAGFNELSRASVSGGAVAGCSGLGNYLLLPGRGGTAGIGGCPGIGGVSPSAQATASLGTRLDLTGITQIDLSLTLKAETALTGSKVTCGSTDTPLDLGINTSGCGGAGASLAALDGCASADITLHGTNTTCGASSDVVVDNIVLRGVPALTAVGESSAGSYTAQLTLKVAGVAVTGVTCQYALPSGGALVDVIDSPIAF